MNEIKYPDYRTFWNIKDENGDIIHQGMTEVNQVTTISGQSTIETNTTDASTLYPPLPDSPINNEEGVFLSSGEIYSHNTSMVIVIQEHNRTIYPPEETPDLFSVYRPNTEGMVWIENEDVEVGDQRLYNGTSYQCVQSHKTLSTWIPPATPALWRVFVSGEWPEWVQPTGSEDAYNIGDKITFQSQRYISTINANVWSPITYPQGWSLQV